MLNPQRTDRPMAGKGAQAGRRTRQRGELLMVRTVAVVAVLLLLLGIPLWMKHERDKRAAPQAAKPIAAQPAARAVVAPSSAAAPEVAVPAAAATPGIGHGLTFAVVADDARLPAEVARLGCAGEPRATDRPLKDDHPCNHQQGDTSCRVVLPVLCIQPGTAAKPAGGAEATYAGWTGGMLAPTQPVMGAILTSAALASARCEKELGSGWRMADVQDGENSGSLTGMRTTNTTLGQGTRYWVQTKDQPANCWNSAGS
ncbi:hypothetical protein [Acidovorax sp.]|uniref:hypothetical protein n=1 Tax=Acidovorax sp. TaxID=1872122 RepID=UPI002ACDC3CC|nr:hypothetical protein [Acidovorax sp.]MDZ7864998.1 hypothetical protein [Acidovorax sp.]